MPLNRMVKPTIGICCEFAQKHGADFVQIFFEKAIDIFARRVYNDIVPGKTGTKKQKGVATKQQKEDFMNNNNIFTALKVRRAGTECASCGAHNPAKGEMWLVAGDAANITGDGSDVRTGWSAYICPECYNNGAKIRAVANKRGAGIKSDKTAPVTVTATINPFSEWATPARVLLLSAGFKFANGKYTITAGCGGVFKWIKAHITNFPISRMEVIDHMSGEIKPFDRVDPDAMIAWVENIQSRVHGSKVQSRKPTK